MCAPCGYICNTFVRANSTDTLGETTLNISLAGVLAQEASPETALQLIQLLEKAQTEFNDEVMKAKAASHRLMDGDALALDKAIALLRTKGKAAARKSPESPPASAPATSARPAAPPAKAQAKAPALGPTPLPETPPAVGPLYVSPPGVAVPPSFARPFDAVTGPDREELNRQLHLLSQEREAFLKERAELNPLIGKGTAEDQKAVRDRLKAAQDRFSAALKRWADISNARLAADRERRAAAKPADGK